MSVAMPRFGLPASSKAFVPALEPSDQLTPYLSSAVATKAVDVFSLAKNLTLPASARDDLLGEMFSCEISVSNHTEEPATNVVIKAELQSSVRKIALYDNTESPILKFEGGQSVDFLGKERLSEIGVHILACSVSYLSKTNEKKFFQKFFKFNVTNPFTVENRLLPVRNGFTVQSRLTNSTNRSLFLSSIKFSAAEPQRFSVRDVNPKSSSNIDLPGLPTIDNAMYMRPGDTRQFLFLVDRTEQAPSPQKELLILGRMEYSWSSAMGEAGAWTSEQLTAPAPQLRPFSLLIEDIPGEVFADSPFTVKFTLRNETESTIAAAVQVTAAATASQLLVSGVSRFPLPDLAPKAAHSFPLTFVAHAHGIQTLASLVVADRGGNKIVEFTDVLEFFVERDKVKSAK